jgi:hypothetical protein
VDVLRKLLDKWNDQLLADFFLASPHVGCFDLMTV